KKGAAARQTILPCVRLRMLADSVWYIRSPSNPEKIAIKRVVALEGDIVHTRPPYPYPRAEVPTGHLWVEGDEGGRQTIDSNQFGPVSSRSYGIGDEYGLMIVVADFKE